MTCTTQNEDSKSTRNHFNICSKRHDCLEVIYASRQVLANTVKSYNYLKGVLTLIFDRLVLN